MAGGLRPGQSVRRRLSDPGRPDARRSHPHPGGGRPPGRRLRRPADGGAGLRHPGRPGDGGPLRVPVGPVSLHSLPGGGGGQRAGRVLLAEQGRSQLLPQPCHPPPGGERQHGEPVRAQRRGGLAADASLFHPGRGPLRQDHRRRAGRVLLPVQLLALLADHVRLREVALRPGDEAVSAALPPPHRRAARPVGPEIHQIQPV